ncbi:sugar phosphate isomerase/epimerase family protein [Peribacillus sp. NPDC097675]|uniref:sugar phosphate isomerase/epimerase family protein n=1 Tax=Peribacillus sp. NPDC097675 TaxID=3390618 RepID=UPI003D0766CD
MNLNLGVRAHDMEKRPLAELSRAIAAKGFTEIQLALRKSFDGMNIKPGSLSSDLARSISHSFQQQRIGIAVLGCYINVIHPNLDERNKGLDFFKEHIHFAKEFGCKIVGTETGNVYANIKYTEENFREGPFQAVVNSVRDLVKEAEKSDVIVGIEPGVNHPIHSPKTMRRLIDAIRSPNLQVILDPVNLLTSETYKNQNIIIQEAFDLLGDHIVIIHAKDFTINDGELKIVPVGEGLLNYQKIFSLVKESKPAIPVLMESTKEKDMENSILYLRKQYKSSEQTDK